MRHLKNLFLYCLAVVLTTWLIGFVAFCVYALTLQSDLSEKRDAVVVLTGGSQRIETGIRLMEQQNADYLLISGVNKQVKRGVLLKDVSPEQRKKSRWAMRRKIRSATQKKLMNGLKKRKSAPFYW